MDCDTGRPLPQGVLTGLIGRQDVPILERRSVLVPRISRYVLDSKQIDTIAQQHIRPGHRCQVPRNMIAKQLHQQCQSIAYQMSSLQFRISNVLTTNARYNTFVRS